MEDVLEWKQHSNTAVDALLTLGRVFGLRSSVYVECVGYVFLSGNGAISGMLEAEMLPSYDQVLKYARKCLKTDDKEV